MSPFSQPPINMIPTTSAGPPAAGMDMAAMLMGGGGEQQAGPDPGAQVWRELMQGLSTQGLGALAPGAGVFSDASRAMLAPEYQRHGGK